MQLFIAMLVTGMAAAAESDATCWTTKSDTYYHLDEHCPGEETRYPMTVEAALAFEKLPCPVCAAPAPEDAEALSPMAATERGGTWVIRVPGDRLEAAVLAVPAQTAPGEPLVKLLGGTISDAVEQRVAVPEGEGLFLNLRLIDGDCYLVLRPDAPYSADHPLVWRAKALAIDMFMSAEPRLSGVSGTMEYVPEVEKGDYTQVFSQKYGGLDIAVYRAIGVNIAVLHQDKGGEAPIGTVRIGDLTPEIPVRGYNTGKQAVFCCVITDAELGALVAGAVPEIQLSAEAAPDAIEASTDPEPDGSAVTLPDLSGDALGVEWADDLKE